MEQLSTGEHGESTANWQFPEQSVSHNKNRAFLVFLDYPRFGLFSSNQSASHSTGERTKIEFEVWIDH